MPTTTELTVKYIEEHPSIKDCLKKGVVNYSKLSRRISKELKIEKKTSMEAILIACRRYAEKLKMYKEQEDMVFEILKKSELEIKNKIVVVIVEKGIYSENLVQIEKKIRKSADYFYAIEGTKAFTMVTSEKNFDDLKQLFKQKIIKIIKGLALIVIKSPEEIEYTPGFMGYLYSLFGERGINIGQTMSCWTDTMIVVEEKDIPKILEFLRF